MYKRELVGLYWLAIQGRLVERALQELVGIELALHRACITDCKGYRNLACEDLKTFAVTPISLTGSEKVQS